ncbi:chromosome partition protein Smc-like [Mytilus edulis]|uniref:chromosome partition protein Smc-like n=1 Tax=Mytilus edulis TaxID=6550 RepID=UPI0039F03FC3
MASNWSNCGVCLYRQVTKPSVVWYSECDEGLCGDCNEHHSIAKASRNHETVFIAEYKKLPIEILQIATICKIHNEKYELFCKKHDCPCCKKCLKSHNDCKGLTDINELIKNVKTSNAFYEIEQTLLEVAENIKLIKSNREDNLTSLEKQKREIEEEIKQTRTKIIRHLDGLQDNLMKELKAAEQKENNKIQKLLTDLKTKERDITEFKENIANIKQNASELQAYLTIKHFEKEISRDEQFIHSIIKSDATNRANISCQFTKSLAQITANIEKFGEINVSSDPCDFSIQKRKQKQAQIIVARPTRHIDNLTLTLQKRINTELSNVHGCTLLPDEKMVFSCFRQGNIAVFKSDGSKDFVINEITRTFDVVYIADDSIAVTSGGLEQINIIDTKNKKIKKTIQVYSENTGAAYNDGHLIYCIQKKGIQRISLSDESITNVISTKLSGLAYVTTFCDKLFYTDPANHSVTCCDNHSNILWTFCSKSVLKCPLGISVDNDGNVFVVGRNTNNVVAISPDGQHYRQLLSHTDELYHPQVLHYDTSTNKLLVSNEKETAFLYDVNK